MLDMTRLHVTVHVVTGLLRLYRSPSINFTTLYFKTTLDYKTTWFGPTWQISVLNYLYFWTTHTGTYIYILFNAQRVS